MNRKRAILLFLSAVLLLLILLPCKLTWQKMRQSRLDRTLIASLQMGDEGDADRALAVLKQGANPNAFENEDPPLSAWQQLLQIVQHTPTEQRKSGYYHGERSALVLAIGDQRWAVARELLKLGATDINGLVYLDDGWGAESYSLLQEAIGYDDGVARTLLERGADANVCGGRGTCPLNVVLNDNLSMVKELVRLGADVNQGGYRGITPLIQASGECKPVTVRFLLEHGADPNAADGYDHTPLSEARTRHDGLSAETVKLLREFGAKK